MAAIAGGCDALSVPSASAVASTNCAQLSWTGQGSISGNMTFYMGYVDVLTQSQLNSFVNAGLSVCVFYENSIGRGPQGALGYNPTNPQYFTFAQGVADGTDARNFASAQLGWPSTRPIYYTVDFASTASNVTAIGLYFQGVNSVDNYVGMYGNAGTMQGVQLTNAVKYFWQNESLGEFNNGSLWQYSSGWQVFNGGHLSLSNGDTSIDGDFAFQGTGQAVGDFGQYPFNTGPTEGTETTAVCTTPSMTYEQPAQETIVVPTNNYDKVLYSNSITITNISESSWPYTYVAPNPEIGQYAYTIGNFTAKVNGTSNPTQDFGQIVTSDGGYGQFPGSLPNLMVQPTIDGSGNLSFIIDYLPGGSATINSITLNYALMSYVGASNLNLQQVSQNIGYANVAPLIEPGPYATYRRIAIDKKITTGGTSSFSHGLGTIPNLLYWAQDTAGGLEVQSNSGSNQTNGINNDFLSIAMNSTFVYTNLDAANESMYLRIYKDN